MPLVASCGCSDVVPSSSFSAPAEFLDYGLAQLLGAVEQHERGDDDEDGVVEDGVEECAEIEAFTPTPGHVGVAEVQQDPRRDAHD